jgi:hypothetical protein
MPRLARGGAHVARLRAHDPAPRAAPLRRSRGTRARRVSLGFAGLLCELLRLRASPGAAASALAAFLPAVSLADLPEAALPRLGRRLFRGGCLLRGLLSAGIASSAAFSPRAFSQQAGFFSPPAFFAAAGFFSAAGASRLSQPAFSALFSRGAFAGAGLGGVWRLSRPRRSSTSSPSRRDRGRCASARTRRACARPSTR